MTFEELLETQSREIERQKKLENRIYCCSGAGCISCGGDTLRKAVGDEIKSRSAPRHGLHESSLGHLPKLQQLASSVP